MRAFTDVLAHLFHPRRSNNHRPRVLHPEALLLLAFVAIGFSFLIYRTTFFSNGFGSILGYATSITVSQVVEQTNQLRQAQGLKPLQANTQLQQAAAQKAAHMFAQQYWSHVSPSGVQPWTFITDSGYSYQWAGENLARDFSQTPEMMTAWMNSPSHKANIMSDRYTEIGVAVVNGTLHNQETTLVVQMFGTPRELVATVPESAQATSLAREVVPVPEDAPVPAPAVQGSAVAPQGGLAPQPHMSPLVLLQAFMISIIVMLVTVLFYDLLVAHDKNILRLVGNNAAHISLLLTVAFLIVVFKSGSIL